MESVGFKEWALVCEALARGEQSLILRKGGIAEGRGGFAFKHREFFLFPTFFHEQLNQVRVTALDFSESSNGEVVIRAAARIEAEQFITRLEIAETLEPLHVLRNSVVRERFAYGQGPGLHVVFLRVFALRPSWRFPDMPSFRGCRSWIPLPEQPAEIEFHPVLGDSDHRRRAQFFAEVTDSSATAAE